MAIKRNENVLNILFIYLFLERGDGEETERERNIDVWLVASCVTPTGYLACNTGMCPHWELNQQPFDSQAGVNYTSQGSFSFKYGKMYMT